MQLWLFLLLKTNTNPILCTFPTFSFVSLSLSLSLPIFLKLYCVSASNVPIIQIPHHTKSQYFIAAFVYQSVPYSLVNSNYQVKKAMDILSLSLSLPLIHIIGKKST